MKAFVIALALAFGPASTSAAACTIVDKTTLVGISTATQGGCTGASLAEGKTCSYKIDDGYTATGTLINSCSSTGVLDVTASIAAPTGCAVNWLQTGANAAAGCTACATGQSIAAAAFGAAATTCTGCKADFLQAGTSVAAGCTACGTGQYIASAAFGAAATTCTGCKADFKQVYHATNLICTACGTGQYKPSAAFTYLGTDLTCDGCKQDFKQTTGLVAGGCTGCSFGPEGYFTKTGIIVKAAFEGSAFTVAQTCEVWPGLGLVAEHDGCAAGFYQITGSIANTATSTAEVSATCYACPTGKSALGAVGGKTAVPQTVADCVDPAAAADAAAAAASTAASAAAASSATSATVSVSAAVAAAIAAAVALV